MTYFKFDCFKYSFVNKKWVDTFINLVLSLQRKSKPLNV
jgi:hypothetical protein